MRVSIFGLGATGSRLAELAADAAWSVRGYSRRACEGDGCILDLAEPESWPAEPASADAVVVTASPLGISPEFWPWVARVATRRVLLGTTGIYDRSAAVDGIIRDDSPTSANHPRAESEDSFIRAGGSVVRLSGIYGRGRDPVRWVTEGRVGYETRQVNLVHVDDIAAALMAILRLTRVAPVYALADGQRHSWKDIIDFLVSEGRIRHERRAVPSRKPDCLVVPERFMKDVPDFRFRDLYAWFRAQAPPSSGS